MLGTKQYKIGENGEWREYTGILNLSEESVTIYAKYIARDGRESEEVSKRISKILKYTNAGSYMVGNTDYDKIEQVKKLVDKTYDEKWDSVLDFGSWCSETIYFQDNKEEAVNASKIKIVTFGNGSGYEPVKEFYITASDTVDFSDEVEIYRGTHVLDTDFNGYKVSNHQFEMQGSYRYYRLYVTSWWPFNEMNGQNIVAFYIE